MRIAICKNIRDFESNDDVKVTVILSNVEKAFCAGTNIKEFSNKTSKYFVNNDIFEQLHDTVYGAEKPIIAGVNGVALGGGCQLALLYDVIFCSKQARFGLPQLRLGLIPGIGETLRLVKIVGKVNSMRYLLTLELICAQRAYQMGIVSEVLKNDELHSKVIQLTIQIANKPITALKSAEKAIKQSENLRIRDGVALQRKLFFPLYDTKRTHEGISAFVEKRKPNMQNLWFLMGFQITKEKILKEAQYYLLLVAIQSGISKLNCKKIFYKKFKCSIKMKAKFGQLTPFVLILRQGTKNEEGRKMKRTQRYPFVEKQMKC